MSGVFDGKVVVVTGGSRGIGRAIVLGALERQASVVFCGRSLGEASDEVLAAADALGARDRLLAVEADVSKESDVEALFDQTLERFDRVDAAVNNAAISRDDLLLRMPTEVFDEVIANNLTAPFLVSRRAVQEFLGQGEGGAIVNIGSLSQNGATSQAAYSASKGGLQGLTRSIAKEYGRRGVRANVVVGGYVQTRMSDQIPEAFRTFLIDHCPQRRLGEPEEVADVALFLASERASFINGESIHATGGLVDVPL